MFPIEALDMEMKDNKSIYFHVCGESPQTNTALDGSTINAVQNNCVGDSILKDLLNAISKADRSGLSKEDSQTEKKQKLFKAKLHTKVCEYDSG